MATPTGPETPPPSKDAGADEVQSDIERTREDLGHTVEALAEKLDVKAQTQRAAQDGKQRAIELGREAQQRVNELVAHARDAATDDQGKIRPDVAKGAVAAVALAIVVAAWRRKR